MQTVGISKLSGYKILNPCNLCYNFALYLLHSSVLRREAVEIRNRKGFYYTKRKKICTVMNNEGQKGIYFKSKQAVLCLLLKIRNTRPHSGKYIIKIAI